MERTERRRERGWQDGRKRGTILQAQVRSFALRFEIMQRQSFSGSYSYAIGTPACPAYAGLCGSFASLLGNKLRRTRTCRTILRDFTQIDLISSLDLSPLFFNFYDTSEHIDVIFVRYVDIFVKIHVALDRFFNPFLWGNSNSLRVARATNKIRLFLYPTTLSTLRNTAVPLFEDRLASSETVATFAQRPLRMVLVPICLTLRLELPSTFDSVAKRVRRDRSKVRDGRGCRLFFLFFLFFLEGTRKKTRIKLLLKSFPLPLPLRFPRVKTTTLDFLFSRSSLNAFW